MLNVTIKDGDRESAYKAELLKVQKDQIRLNGILIDSMGRCLSKLDERDK